MAAQAQDQVKYGIVRDPKVVAKMEAAADTQYTTPSIHLFRRLDKQNLTFPTEVRADAHRYYSCNAAPAVHLHTGSYRFLVVPMSVTHKAVWKPV